MDDEKACLVEVEVAPAAPAARAVAPVARKRSAETASARATRATTTTGLVRGESHPRRASRPTSQPASGQSLTPIAFASGDILYQPHSRIDRVYFPETAVVSLLSRMENGAVVEVGTIGNEGAAGLDLFLGADISIPETLVQIPGNAQHIAAADFRAAIDSMPTLRSIVGRCIHAFVTQVSQTAACNRLHSLEQRCARWLLLTHDRVGAADSFSLTHQFLSFMLGVRRAGVTEALGALTSAGLIRSKGGQITVLDRDGLEAACCECYAIVRRHSGAPFAPTAIAKGEHASALSAIIKVS